MEALAHMPEKVRGALKDTVVKVGSEGSAYDPVKDTIYIGKNATLAEAIHEIGHAIEGKLFDKDKVDFVKRQCVKGMTVNDIVRRKGTDSSGDSSDVFILKSDKLLDDYQGRLYINYPLEALLPDGTLDIECMGEFVSVAVEKYYESSRAVRKNNYDIFSLVDEVLG